MTSSFQSAGRTVTGKVRGHNEDAILVRDEVGLWVVADGLGGHSAGDYASQMIVDRLGALARDGSVFDFIESIEDTLVQINTDLVQTAVARGVDLIGSTVVMAVHDSEFMLFGWVGDSRAYGFVDDQLRQITRDHVHGGDVDVTHFGEQAPPQAGSGVLTRAVGAEDQLFVDWVVARQQPGVSYILCSDGINKEMSDLELAEQCRANPQPAALLASLFDLALSRSARDNISAVIVRVGA